jgi:subtilisin family serine protease
VDRVLNSPRLRPLPFDPPIGRGPLTTSPSRPVWNVDLIGAPAVWDQFDVDGRGIVLGESDSGVDARHPALRENYRGRGGNDDYNWYDPWNDTRSPVDQGGHGTHTTGTAVGRQNVGVAPGAEWIGCTNLARNLGNPAFYLDCLQFMLAPFPRDGDPLRDGDPTRSADVLNNSWGCPGLEGCDAGSLHTAARALKAAGIFVVVSAGNTGDAGCGTVRDPLALYPEAFSVGSVNRQREVSTFSSRGPVTVDGSDRDKPDIVAPGEDIVSALPDGTYGPNDGTSMAGPHVAGVVALMWQANPGLVGDVDRTADLLRQTAQPAEPTLRSRTDECGGTANITGAGLVDALAAVRAARG